VRIRRFTVTALMLAVLSMLAVMAPSASAVTGGQPDGDRHSNVGLILFYTEEGRFRCSATLISPTVLLTAAHCTDGVLGSTLVTFDSVIAEQPPSPFPVAADPSEGYTDAEIEAAGYLSGTAYTHPEYSGFTDLANWNDVGVIVLDEPVVGIEPAEVAPLGSLDQFSQPALNRTIFEVVGYGTEVGWPTRVTGPGAPSSRRGRTLATAPPRGRSPRPRRGRDRPRRRACPSRDRRPCGRR
jgi:hypothetical protein